MWDVEFKARELCLVRSAELKTRRDHLSGKGFVNICLAKVLWTVPDWSVSAFLRTNEEKHFPMQSEAGSYPPGKWVPLLGQHRKTFYLHWHKFLIENHTLTLRDRITISQCFFQPKFCRIGYGSFRREKHNIFGVVDFDSVQLKFKNVPDRMSAIKSRKFVNADVSCLGPEKSLT